MTPQELRKEMDERNLTLNRAAFVLKVDRQTVWRYLHGVRSITDDRAELIRLRLDQFDEWVKKTGFKWE